DDIPEVDEVARWLAARMHDVAGKSAAALVHNDWKFDNLVLDPTDPTRIVGVLDWEMSTLGDPLMDLGTALSYWVEGGDPDEAKMFAFGPTFAPGALTRREVVERYAAVTGLDAGAIRRVLAHARGTGKVSGDDAVTLMAEYLEAVAQLGRWVDGQPG
ncbi:MAG: phosphotransferase, partial [Gemmatimonadaceae bacterium]|nr:phosphotransferase [Gemmatimonadaceae bacterium]